MVTDSVEKTNLQEQFIQTRLERSILSTVAEVSSAKNKAELFPIINNSFKKLFAYDDGVVWLLNDDQKTHSAFLYNTGEGFTNYQGCGQLAELQCPINNGIHNTIVNSAEVLVFELEEVSKLPNASVYFSFRVQQGMTQLIGVPLKTGIKTIGSFSFYTKSKNAIPKNQFSLLYGLCSQVAIVIQNILIHELNERNNFEKNILLDICYGLSLSKERADLAKVIHNKLSKLLPFNDCVLGVFNTFNDRLFNFTIETTEYGQSEKNPVLYSEMVLTNEIRKLLDNTHSPVILDLRGSSKNNLSQSLLKDITPRKSQEAAIVGLFEHNKPIGFLALFSNNPDNFKKRGLLLLKGVADQLSLVASKILIKEDIRKKEKEQTFFLAFSNHIATVRDFNGLKFIIRQSLKELFQIKAYIINIKNNDDNTYSHFLHDLAGNEPVDEDFRIEIGTKFQVKGTLIAAVLNAEDPVIFDINEIFKSKKYFFPSYSFWRSAGADKIQGIRLKVANEDLGILWIESGTINDRLLKGISAQIALALSNAMANASLERQFNEIKLYKERSKEENFNTQQKADADHIHNEIIGSGIEMQKVFHLLSQVAYANSTVLLLGETGTGKELIARTIHNNSPRKDKLMVKVNCAAFPTYLIESELFGHERGSFTGAFEQKIGKFELANNSTLFLDEIGEMPHDLQMKILRALQEREIERVGGKKTIKINVRIIAATNRDLQHEIREGRFRSDLFYRLNVFPITLPPLRKRIEDIPLLVDHFIVKYTKNSGKQINSISQKALQELSNYSWPGNIRELEHVIERSMLLSTGNIIKQVELPVSDKKIKLSQHNGGVFKTIDENEREHIIVALGKCGGKIFGQGGAAEILGVPPSTLNSKMKKLNIKKDRFFNS